MTFEYWIDTYKLELDIEEEGDTMTSRFYNCQFTNEKPSNKHQYVVEVAGGWMVKTLLKSEVLNYKFSLDVLSNKSEPYDLLNEYIKNN